MGEAVNPAVLEERLNNLKEDLSEVKSDVKGMRDELKQVIAIQNQQKGASKVALILSGMFGGALVKWLLG